MTSGLNYIKKKEQNEMEKLTKVEREKMVNDIAFMAEYVNEFPVKLYHINRWNKEHDFDLILIHEKWKGLFWEKRRGEKVEK